MKSWYTDDELKNFELLKKSHQGFKIICDKCNSENTYIDSNVGFSELSGSWGAVSIKCVECDNEIDIWEA